VPLALPYFSLCWDRGGMTSFKTRFHRWFELSGLPTQKGVDPPIFFSPVLIEWTVFVRGALRRLSPLGGTTKVICLHSCDRVFFLTDGTAFGRRDDFGGLPVSILWRKGKSSRSLRCSLFLPRGDQGGRFLPVFLCGPPPVLHGGLSSSS